MSERKQFSPEDVDALVREVLRGEAKRVDADRLRADIEQQLRLPEKTPTAVATSRSPTWKILSGRGIGIAAALMILVGVVSWLSFPDSISAQAILASAERVPESDRCYQVSISSTSAARSRNFLLRSEWDANVWANGKRFRVTMHSKNKDFVWGQDARGNVWVVVNPNLGLLYRADESPKILRGAREILGLSAQRLTKRFSDQYILEYRPPAPNDGTHVAVIQATARPEASNAMTNVITSARFVIDRDSYLIRQLTLTHEKGLMAHAEVNFRLVDVQPPSGNPYRLVDNLSRGATILDSSHAEDRNRAFQELMKSLGAPDRPSSD